MRKGFLRCMAIAIFTVFLSTGPVFAQENMGYYVTISGGYVIPQTMTLSDPDGGYKYADTTLNNGYTVGITTGWLTPFTKRIMALEIEYNYINNNFDNNKVFYLDAPGMYGYGTFDGTITAHSVLFNVKARYPEGRIHPYVGFGMGWSYFVVGDITATEVGGSSVRIEGEAGNALCWQFLTGVDFDITPNLGVAIGYKYFATKATVGSNNAEGMYADIDYRASIITAGVTFTF